MTLTQEPSTSVDIRTTRADSLRATITIGGRLDAASGPLLAQVVESHLRGGRRYLRLNVGGLRAVDAAGLAVISAAHERLLAERGTMILTGALEPIESLLRSAPVVSPLLVVSATAEEIAR